MSMMLDVLLAPGFPHATPEGYRRGCRGAVCPGREAVGFSCADAFVWYSGDWWYRARVDIGFTPEHLAPLIRARAEQARLDDERKAAVERAAREREAAAQRAAEESVAAARAEADRLISEARRRVAELGTVRSTVLSQLSAVRSILDRVPGATGASLEEWPGRTDG